jgi:DivIVA domain-containing protein
VKWFILVIGLVVVCYVAALLLGLVRGGGMGAPTSSMRHDPLPDTPLTDEDLDALAFDVTARGYRMSEVDAVVDRLRRELREKDEEIAVLRGDAERVLPDPAQAPDTAHAIETPGADLTDGPSTTDASGTSEATETREPPAPAGPAPAPERQPT